MEPSQTTLPPRPAPAPLTVDLAADSCASCGTQMAADQRYCVECGHRRGAARVPGLDAGPRPSGATSSTTVVAEPSRLPPGAALIAVVGTLLLAIGIGVLIGRSDNSSSSPKTATQVVTVVSSGSGVGAGATGTSAGATTPATSGSSTTGSGSGAKSRAAKKAATTKASSGGSAAKAPPAKAVKIGSPGTGAGYTNGKFTGNFF